MTFLKAEVLVYQNNLKTAFYAAEPCRQYLTADTLRTLAVKAGSILRAWCINTKTLCIDRRSLISCPAHRVCLCFYDLIHSHDQKYVLWSIGIGSHTVCIAIDINEHAIFTHGIHAS